MPARKFEYHPEAVAEASEAFQWYDAQSPAAAEGFWDELRRARRLVTARPETWGPYYHGTRCFRLNRYPYDLVYLIKEDLVVGIAVAHFNRKPGYWKRRLKEQGKPDRS